jgi:hypothetical protein
LYSDGFLHKESAGYLPLFLAHLLRVEKFRRNYGVLQIASGQESTDFGRTGNVNERRTGSLTSCGPAQSFSAMRQPETIRAWHLLLLGELTAPLRYMTIHSCRRPRSSSMELLLCD